MIIMLVAAFITGIVLFVVALRVIRELKKEQRLAARRKTTSLHIAKVVSAIVGKREEEEAAADADAAAEAGESSPPEPVGDPADGFADESIDDSVDEPADGYIEESADGYVDESVDVEESSDEYAAESVDEAADDAQSDDEPVDSDASADKPLYSARQALYDVPDVGSDEETRETQAVSLAEIMASDDDESEPAAAAKAQPIEPPQKARPIQSIHMKPIEPLRTLQPVEDKVDGMSKLAGVNKRRLPETVKMKERRVLLAEDIKVHRELIEMFFEGSGVKFEFAENGLEACDMFLSNPEGYSLILMDIHMPVMDGYEAAKKIRSMDIDWAKQIPIVAMTADTTEDDISKCFEAGMDDHIVKPIDMAILQDRVFEFVTRDSE